LGLPSAVTLLVDRTYEDAVWVSRECKARIRSLSGS